MIVKLLYYHHVIAPNTNVQLNASNNDTEKDLTPTDIVSIFTNKLIEYKQSTSSNESSRKPTTRLKRAKYGEVLTTLEVKKRLKEAELKKIAKLNAPKGPRGRQKKM